MSVINIYRSHQYPPGELKLKIDDIKNDIEEKYELRSEWETDQCLLFCKKGLKGTIEIDEHKFQFTLNLSMMYRMMEAEIKQEILVVVNRHLS